MAIKVFSRERNNSQKLRELEVRQKLQAVKAIGITKLIEHFEDDQFVYQVTSLMNMGTLQNFMEKSSMSYLTLEEMKSSAYQIVFAVQAIHAAGYLHNDI